MSDTIIVDASVAMKWLMPEPCTPEAEALLGRRLQAPELLLAECGNALWRRTRSGEIATADADFLLDRLAATPIDLVPDRVLAIDGLRLANEIGHPVYDCLYLALALIRDARLVTADRRFHRAVQMHPGYAARTVLLGAAA